MAVLIILLNFLGLLSDSDTDSDRTILYEHDDDGNYFSIDQNLTFDFDSVKKANKVFKKFREYPCSGVKEILKNATKEHANFIMTRSPIRPLSNEGFLYKPSTDKLCLNDGYFWGPSDMRENGIGVTRIRYYYRKNKIRNTRWSRCVFFLTKTPPKDRVYLIIYIGDDTFAQNTPINDKTSRTTLNKIKDQRELPPMKAYKNILSETRKQLNEIDELDDNSKSHYEKTSTVKNLKQVYNVQYYQRKKNELGPDRIVNILEFHMHFDSFIHFYSLIPEMQIICGSKEALLYSQNLFKFCKSNVRHELCLSYDTTFDINKDFLVSILTVKNIFMEKNPIFPMLFHITETKREKRHSEFMFFLNNNFNLKEYPNIPLITDCEPGIFKSVIFNNLNLCLCTLHIINSVNR